MLEFVLTMIPKDFIFLVIFTSPNGTTIDFWLSELRSLKVLFFNDYLDNFVLTCKDHNDPIEKYLNEICKKEICISPIPSLSIHMANANSIFGVSPFVDVKSDWKK